MSNQQIARKRGELFRRLKPSTLAKLIEELGPSESIYDLGTGFEQDTFMQDEETKSVISEAPSNVGSVITVATEQLGLNAESEFLLLDLREYEEYQLFHIKEAISFPAPNISRDRMLPELYRFRNQPGKLIIIYTWDERPGVASAQKFAEKGFENVYLISGGLEAFTEHFPNLIEGTKPPSPQKTVKGQKSATGRRQKSNAFTAEGQGNPFRSNRPLKFE